MTNAFLWEDHASTMDNTPVSPPDINMHAGWTLQIRVDTSSTAGYGQASYAITDTARDSRVACATPRMTATGRSTAKTTIARLTRLRSLQCPMAPATGAKWTWKVGGELDVGEDTMLYATVSTGFLAGNQQGAFNGTNSYDEQTVTAFELGQQVACSRTAAYDSTRRSMSTSSKICWPPVSWTPAPPRWPLPTTPARSTRWGWKSNWTGRLPINCNWAPELSMQQAEYGDFALPNVFQEGGDNNQWNCQSVPVGWAPGSELSPISRLRCSAATWWTWAVRAR